jgi:ribose transport system permease protein
MKNSRFLADYGMVLVLLLLCAFFSVVTMKEQWPSGEAGARQVVESINEKYSKTARVIVVASTQSGDPEFADAFEREFTAAGGKVLAVVKGDPKDARESLAKLNAAGEKVDAIASTRVVASTWAVFEDLKADFPALGEPRIVSPSSYKWPNFLKAGNLLNIANQIAVIAIIAIGMTMVIITGGIDLSVGSILALSAVIAALIIREIGGGVNAGVGAMVGACFLAVILCGLVGGLSGIIITRFAVPPFIATLAFMLIGKGRAFTLADNQSVYQLPESFVWLGRGADLFGLPNAVTLMVVLYVIAHIVMSRTTLGRHIYAVGGNREAARLSGVPVNRVILFAYVTCSMLAAVGGVIQASLFKSGSPTYGNMYELYVIAAVIVGGTSISGGEGKMFGTLIGAFIIAVIQNGMNLMDVGSNKQMEVLGAVILGAVLLDKLRQREAPSLRHE